MKKEQKLNEAMSKSWAKHVYEAVTGMKKGKYGKVTDIREARQRRQVTYPCLFPFAMKNPFVTTKAENRGKPC